MTASALVAGVFAIAAAVLLWYLFDVLLLLFAAILVAVVLRAPTYWIAHRTRLSDPWALAVVLVLAVALLGGVGWLMGAAIREQVAQLAEQLPQMLEQARSRLDQYAWISGSLQPGEMLDGREGAFLGRGLQVVTATFGAIANLALILFMAVLFAAQPKLYVRGVLHLTPKHKRERVGALLSRLDEALRRWLLGQLLLMAFVAVATMLGLWLLGMRYPLALGLIAGLLTFVPFIGPLLASAIAILISLADGLMAAVWVGLLYLGVQIVEGMLEPIVQQRTIYLPPVLLIASQITLGVLVGVLGVILATPLAGVLMVAVQMLYVEDVLGDSVADA